MTRPARNGSRSRIDVRFGATDLRAYPRPNPSPVIGRGVFRSFALRRRLDDDPPGLGDELVAASAADQMGEAGQMQVAAGHQQPLRRHQIENAPSVFFGLTLVDVELARHLRTRNL